MADELQVSYTIKEVLDRMDGKLDAALQALAGKADASKVEVIETRLQAVETHIEHQKQTATSRSHFKEWLIPALLTLVIALSSILQSFHVHF